MIVWAFFVLAQLGTARGHGQDLSFRIVTCVTLHFHRYSLKFWKQVLGKLYTEDFAKLCVQQDE